MGYDSQDPRSLPGFELIERPAVSAWMVWPELVRPDPRIRSPIMDPRRRQALRLGPDHRPAVLLPAARDALGPMVWATLIAVPVMVGVGWQAALLAAAVTACIRIVDGRMARSELTFASGLLGYRPPTEWPRGVQEDDDVRWNWSGAPRQQGI
jgi:hypothetical protein